MRQAHVVVGSTSKLERFGLVEGSNVNGNIGETLSIGHFAAQLEVDVAAPAVKLLVTLCQSKDVLETTVDSLNSFVELDGFRVEGVVFMALSKLTELIGAPSIDHSFVRKSHTEVLT